MLVTVQVAGLLATPIYNVKNEIRVIILNYD